MNNKKIKNVFSRAFIVGLAAIAVSGMNVNAATVKETAGKEIENGAYIIGITRFTNDVVLTADRVLTAGQNDMFFKGIYNYQKPTVYQYRGGNWIKYDEENNSSLVSAADVASLKLNTQNIYYENNVEKILEVAYNREIATGTTLNFTTDAIGKKITYSNGKMYVPATTKTITVEAVASNGSKTKLETLEKTPETEAGDFDYRSATSAYYGAISADNILTKSEDVNVNGETITIGGTIAWSNGSAIHGADYVTEDATKSGHRIGVKITAPNGTTLTADKMALINIKVDDQSTSKSWTATTTGKDGSFWFTPIVREGQTITVRVVWDSTTAVPQTFTIKVNGTLAPMPAGTLSGDNIYVKDDNNQDTSTVNISAVSNSTDLVTFSGQAMPWDGKATVKVRLNSYYTNNDAYDFDNDAVVSVNYLMPDEDDDGYPIVTPVSANYDSITYDEQTKTVSINGLVFKDSDNERKIRVSIQWDKSEEYTQEIDVVLADNTPFAYPDVRLDPVRTFVGYKSNGEPDYNRYNVEGDTATVARTQILWSIPSDDNGIKYSGNRVLATLRPSTTVNNAGTDYEDDVTYTEFTDEDLARMSVRVDGVELGETDEDGNFTPTTFAEEDFDELYEIGVLAKVDANGNGRHTVEVLWDSKVVVKTFYIVLENVTLSAAQTGTYYVNGSHYTSTIDSNTNVVRVDMSTTHSLYAEDDTDKERPIGSEKDSIPFVYEVNSNAVVMTFNNATYENKPLKVLINDKKVLPQTIKVPVYGLKNLPEQKELTGYVVPVAKNAITKVTVYWDEQNSQTYNVTPASSATLEAVKHGAITVNDEDNTNTNKTSVTYSGRIDWKSNGSTTINIAAEEVKHGYTIGTTTTTTEGENPTTTYAPGVVLTAPNGIEAKEPVVTISGGKYSADENAKNFGIVSPKIADDKKSISIDPVVQSANETFTITVKWDKDKDYVETYTLNVSNASLRTVTGTLVASDGRSISNYNGQINYVSGAYTLNTTLTSSTGTVENVKVDDIRTTINSDGEKVLYNLGKTSAPAIQFSNEKRTATVVVTWSDNSVQTFEINATEATIPAVVLASNVETKVEENGTKTYSITAKVGDNIGAIVDRVLPNANAVLYTATPDEKPAEVGKVVLEKDTNGSYIARNVGTSKLKFSVKTSATATPAISEEVEVNVYVVNDAVSVVSTAQFDGDNILNVTSTIQGGTGVYKTVKAQIFAFENGVYSATAAATAYGTINGNGQYVSSLRSNVALPKKYKLVVTVEDTTYAPENKALDNLRVEEVKEYPSVVEYTVTFDSDGGDVITPAVVSAGGVIENIPAPNKVDKVTPNKNVIKYTFVAWYTADSFNADGSLKANATLFNPTAPVDKDATYRAYYAYERYVDEGTTLEDTFVVFKKDGVSTVVTVKKDGKLAVGSIPEGSWVIEGTENALDENTVITGKTVAVVAEEVEEP